MFQCSAFGFDEFNVSLWVQKLRCRPSGMIVSTIAGLMVFESAIRFGDINTRFGGMHPVNANMS